MDLQSTIDRALPATTQLRRRLHRIPELGYEEFKTAAAIRAELDRLQIKYVEPIATVPTATIAWIGDTSRPCVALRADIDALPITEATGVEHCSTHEGRMHACGHDGHISTLMGVATVLKSIERDLPVCVKFIWQPAEEGGGGAERLCDAGVLDGRIGPKVDAIFGLHGWPGAPVGIVTTKPGPLMAATDTFSATFVGRGGHAAFPHFGHDPVVTAAEAVVNLQQFVSREMDPTESAVVSVCMFNAGTTTNVIPDRATIAGTARTLTEAHRAKIEQSIRRRCESIAAANQCRVDFDWQEGYPPTVNDPAMADYVARIARQALGENRFIPAAKPVMGGEDFAYYLQRVPGCFFFVGLNPDRRTDYPLLHTDRFDFNDAALGVGMRMFTELVMNFRNVPKR